MKTIIDLGCGDGRFVYKMAKKHPENQYIGVDPMLSQSKNFQRRINREKLGNAKFVEASVETLPHSLTGTGNEVYVTFPWGSLLGGIATADEKIIAKICGLVADGGKLEITFGYSRDAEPGEAERLGLDHLTLKTIREKIVPEFEKNGLKLKTLGELKKEGLFRIESTWSKVLSFGKQRKIFKITLDKRSNIN